MPLFNIVNVWMGHLHDHSWYITIAEFTVMCVVGLGVWLSKNTKCSWRIIYLTDSENVKVFVDWIKIEPWSAFTALLLGESSLSQFN